MDERLHRARGLGTALAELVDQPEDFVTVARDGLIALSDDGYRAELARVAPDAAPAFGVRAPLLAAIARQLRVPLVESSAASALWLAQRLAEEEEREFTQLAQHALRRVLADDPERAWQLIRRLGHAARDWIAVDSLAELVGEGIMLEPFRWAEIEQLIYSNERWERRLVASTIAALPYRLPPDRRSELVQNQTPALILIESLLGDRDPDVQKALAWALRSWHDVEPHQVEALIQREASRAVSDVDGHRAWVLRDALTAHGMPMPMVGEIRRQLAGIRRRADEPSSSRAHEVARSFVGVSRLADRAIAQQGARQRQTGVDR